MPSEVVKIQLSSLQKNNSPNIDSGILQTWEFAHPKNKSFTGPYDKFKNMIKNIFVTKNYNELMIVEKNCRNTKMIISFTSRDNNELLNFQKNSPN